MGVSLLFYLCLFKTIVNSHSLLSLRDAIFSAQVRPQFRSVPTFTSTS